MPFLGRGIGPGAAIGRQKRVGRRRWLILGGALGYILGKKKGEKEAKEEMNNQGEQKPQ